MSTATVSDVLDRSMRDEAFLDRFHEDPDDALEEFDLTAAERSALSSGSDEAIYDIIGAAKMGWQVSIVVVII